MVYRDVGLLVGHTFKAIWEIFSLGPVSVPLLLYLTTHLEIIRKFPLEIFLEWSSFLPRSSFMCLITFR